MGSQRRSWPTIQELTSQIRDGSLIGRVYFARGWYVNTRASIGVGKPAPVPAGLDYELWQGPAPRREYKDNVIHYNWHWFWNWGTSEACNNGTHEIDVMRWAMGVTFPTKVESFGGRYHFKDDWECADTQTASFEFEGNKSFIWEGRSCNGYLTEGLARGVTFHGDNGSVLVDDDSYTVFDAKGKQVKKVGGAPAEQSTTNTTGPGDRLDMYHVVELPRLGAVAQGAERRDRAGAPQRAVVPPRQRGLPRRPHAAHRPEGRAHPRRHQGAGPVGAHLRARLGA